MSVAAMSQFYQVAVPVRHPNCVAPGPVLLASQGTHGGMRGGVSCATMPFGAASQQAPRGQFAVPSRPQMHGQGATMMAATCPPSAFVPAASMSHMPMSDNVRQGAGKDGVILCIGDSLTAGVKNTPNAYPANLDDLLRQKGLDFTIQNEGVYAETSDSLVQRLPHAIAKASTLGPLKFIFVLTGTNDILQFRTPESILANLRRIHDVAAATPGSPHVGALTVPQCRLFRPQQEMMRSMVNAGIKQISQLPAARPRFVVDLESVNVDLAEDGVHYVGQGYKEFAQLADAAMRNLL